MAILLYPLLVLSFWYKDGIRALFHFFSELNQYVLQLLSFRLLVVTFFKPLKNEYRKDLIGFSIGMGIVLKSALIFVSALIMLVLFLFEGVILFAYILLPILPVYFLIK